MLRVRAAWLLVPASVLGSVLTSCNIYNPSLLTGSGGASSASGTGGAMNVSSTGGSTASSTGAQPATTASTSGTPTVTSSSTSGPMSSSVASTTNSATTASSTTATTSVASTTASTSIATTSVSTTAVTTAATTVTTVATTAMVSSSTGGCMVPSDCPGMDTTCQTRTCTAGNCGFSYQPSGTALPDNTPGDCQKPVCDGSGGTTTIADASDPPASTSQCTMGTCVGTQGMQAPVSNGTACSQNGGTKCSNGTCVGCVVASDCPSGFCNSGTCAPYVLISQVRTRGSNLPSANDEFIELYNPGTAAVTLSSSLSIIGRSSTASTYTTRWVGGGQTLPAHAHFLIGGSAYVGPPAADDVLVSGVTLPDQMSLVLIQGPAGPAQQVIDALCFYCGATNPYDVSYTCEGTPFNKAGCSSTTNYDAAERLPGGAGGNATNTRNNASDFYVQSPSDQRDLMSAPTP